MNYFGGSNSRPFLFTFMKGTPKLIFILTAIILSLSSHAQYYQSTVYKNLEEIPSNRMVEMAQLSSGEIWFATESGLASFDGLKWDQPGQGKDFIPSLGEIKMLPTPKNGLYITGRNENRFTIAHYDNGVWGEIEPPKPMEGVYYGYSAVLNNDNTSELFLAYQQQIFTYSEGQWTSTNIDFPDSSLVIRGLLLENDTSWIITNSGLYRFLDNELTLELKLQRFVKNILKRDKYLYMFGDHWLGRFDINSKTVETLFDGEVRESWNLEQHNLAYRKGKIYFSSNSPLQELDLKTGKVSQIITEGFDTDHTCMKSIFDQEGNLWVATLRGAFKINNLNIIHYNGQKLVENEVSAICERSNGELILGGNVGYNRMKDNGDIETISFPDEWMRIRVMDALEFEGTVFFAASSGGIIKLENNRPIIEYNPKGENFNDLHVFEGVLYAAGSKSLYKRVNSKWVNIFTIEDSTQNYFLRKIAFDSDNQYFLTSNGIYDYNQRVWYKSESASDNNIYCYARYNNEFLLGTSKGIKAFRDGQIVDSIATILDLKQPIYALMPGKNQSGLWVGTGSGLFFSHFDSQIRLWNKNGLEGNEVNRNALKFLRNGRLIVGTDEGLSLINATPDVVKRPIPTPEITGYSLSNANVLDLPSELSNDQNDIIFHYRAITFYNESQLEYRVKLEGADENWQVIPYESQRSVQYNNLPPGNYRFMVKARSGNGEWSESAMSTRFQIKAAIYQRPIFRIGVGLVVILIIISMTRIRNRQLKVRNEKLEDMVKEKTAEINKRNEELIKTIKDLKSAQGQVIQSEKLASMGHLTAGIAHELNNPLNYIRGGAECVIRNLQEMDEYIKMGKLTLPSDLKQSVSYLLEESATLAESILTGSNKSTDIIKSLNSFTSDSQQYLSYNDLEKEVETGLTLLSNQIGFRITINRMFGSLPPVECYPAKINQLIVNLLLNSIQAIKGEGEITIRIFRKDMQYAILEINDNGIGIKPEDYGKIFEPFFTTKESNSGLGLTISEAIVQEHKGKIKVHSTVNEGTKITVWLPFNQEVDTWNPQTIDEVYS